MTYTTICKQLQESGYFDQHQRVLVAVSGGFDSMNLLHCLYVSRETLGIELAIAHVNHQQRPEADQEEAYLRDWAETHDLPIYVTHFEGTFSEGAARAFRYDFFSRVMAEQGYTALVTAHHREDQVETILFRILRGSRLRHLAGIKPVQAFGPGQLIRPFLHLSKKDLPEVVHFEDVSNQSLVYARNRLRLTHLPALRQDSPQLDQHLLDLAAESRKLIEALQDLTKGLSVTDLPSFLKQTQAVQVFLLQDYLASFPDLHLTKAQFEEVLTIIRTQANYRSHLKNGYWLVKSYDDLRIEKINPQTDSHLGQAVLDCDNTLQFGGYSWTFGDQTEPDSYGLASSSALLLRQPKPGDRIKLGNFHKKLSRLFIDDKLPTQVRERAIVVEQDGVIQLVVTAEKTYLRKDGKRAIMKFGLSIKRGE